MKFGDKKGTDLAGMPEKVRAFFSNLTDAEKKDFTDYTKLYLTSNDVVDDIFAAMHRTAEIFDQKNRVYDDNHKRI